MNFERVLIVDEDDYTAHLQSHINEHGFHMMFIHVDVTSKWTKELKKTMQAHFKRLSREMQEPLFTNCKVDDEKHKKWLEMFNFEPQHLVQNPETSDVYILYKHNSIGVH